MLYLIISLAVAALMTFALAGILAPIITFIVFFYVSFGILALIHMTAEGTGPVFGIWSSYSMDVGMFLIMLIPLLLASILGIIIGPFIFVRAILDDDIGKKLGVFATSALLLALAAVGVLLFIKPIIVYRIIHYGWVVGLFIAASLLLCILIYVLKERESVTDTTASFMWLCTVMLIPLMIVGVMISRSATYEIYTAKDMNVLGRAPINHKTAFIVMEDIDFSDEDVSIWYGKRKLFEGVFDGGNHTFYNINISAEDINLKSDYMRGVGFGFVGSNVGVIRNLNFENCRVTLHVKHRKYINDPMYFGIITGANHGGKISNCNVINCQAKYISDVKISPHTSLTVGYNARTSQHDYAKEIEPLVNVNAINDQEIDEYFYKEGGLNWIKIEAEKDQ